VPEPAGAHGGVELEDRRAEVLRRRPELEHVHALGPHPLRHLGGLPVLADGFEWEGRPYRSLSAIARAITGTRWNGWTFFGLEAGRGGA
jgi:hypothetical protein